MKSQSNKSSDLFLQDAEEMRAMFSKHEQSKAAKHLFWRGVPLTEAVQPATVKKILEKVAAQEVDASSYGHGVIGLFKDEKPPEPDPTKSQPTVWYHDDLRSKPWFDDSSEITDKLKKNFSLIREEYKQVTEFIQKHPDNDALAKTGRWSTAMLYGATGRNNQIAALCPKTFEIVESLPLCKNFGFAIFSVLAPGTHLLAHTGSTNLRLRHHLALEVPADRPAQIRVATETREWKQGETLVFDDSFEHEVNMYGSTPRVALIVDVWHPSLSEYDISFLNEKIFSRFGKIIVKQEDD